MYAQQTNSKGGKDGLSLKRKDVDRANFGFIDNRSEAIMQRKLQEASNNHSEKATDLTGKTIQLMSNSRTVSANKKDQLAAARNGLGKYIWSDLSHNVAVIDGDATKSGISDQASHSESKVFIQELTANNVAHTVDMLTERPACTTDAGTGCYDYFTQYAQNNPGWDFNFSYITNPGGGGSTEKQLYGIYRVGNRNPQIPRSNAGDAAN